MPGRRSGGRRGRPNDVARAAHLAGRRRGVLQPGPDTHQASRDGPAQSGSLSAATARPQHGRDALADPQRLERPSRGRRKAWRKAAGRDRVRLRSRDHVCGVGAAACRHRRVPVRRVLATRAGRDGRLPLRAVAGAGRRPGGARRLARAGGAPSGGAVRRPHRLLHARRAVPRATRRDAHHAKEPDLPVDRGRAAASRRRADGQSHRAHLLAAGEADDPRHRRHGHAGRGRVSQLRDREHRQALPEARAQGHARDLGCGHAVAGEADRGRRRRLRRARLLRSRLAGARQRRLHPRPRAHRGAGRPSRPR